MGKNKHYIDSVEEYISKEDWRINANANTGYSNAGLVNNLAGKAIANFWLDKIYTEEEGSKHREGDYHIHDLDSLTGYCFTGDTKVALLEGTSPTLKELAESKDSTDIFWVYSRDEKGGIVAGKAYNPRLTRKDSQLVEVTISGGEKIRCTPDHKFMLRDGTYKEAQDLKKRESLMPLYVSKTGKGYAKVQDCKLNINEYAHRLIAKKYYNIEDMSKLSVHHKNGIKYDNRPENLEAMLDSEHRSLEMRQTINTDTWQKGNRKRLQEYNKSANKRGQISEFAKNRDRNSQGQFYNHTVIEVKPLTETEDVYCLTVEKYGNFALEAGVFVHNCAGWSLRVLLDEGFNGVLGRQNSAAPNHFRTALDQMANFLGILQSEWAGAQAFSSFDTYLAPYVFKDQLSFKEIKKAIRSFVFHLNVPARWGQSPFTNITIDWTVPKDLQEQIPTRYQKHLLSGTEEESLLSIAKLRDEKIEKLSNMTFKHFLPEMQLIQRAYYEVMTEGDNLGNPFTFPIPTVNITEDFDWDGVNTDILFENTAKIGSSYFQNFIGSQYITNKKGERVPNPKAYSPDAVRSMCCRLQLDLRELLKRGGGLFGSAELTGSVGVVTINMARLGYLYSGDLNSLYEELDKLLDLAKSTLEKKRVFVKEMYERGLYPYTKRYLPHFNNHFSTIGVNGMNEMVRNFTHDSYDITDSRGHEMVYGILEHIRDRMVHFQEETGNLYNLEATPAEGTTYRFAKEDKKRYKDIIQAGLGKNIYYTNSSQIPVEHTEDAFTALEMQDDLQIQYTGGTVLHLYMNERMSNGSAAKRLIRQALTNYKLPYITMTPLFSTCPKHGYLAGEHEFCPKCDEEFINEYKGNK